MRYGSRVQTVVAALAGIFVLANILAAALVIVSPQTAVSRGSILVVVFVFTLIISLLCLILLLRWLLRPYNKLIGEAQRAPVAIPAGSSLNEAEFVLETFQNVVAQLQQQQRELERLSAQAHARADTAEKFSDRVIASVPSGLVAFDGGGHATIVNGPARDLIGADESAVGQPVRSVLNTSPELASLVEECLRTGNLYRREELSATNLEGRIRRLGATVAPIDDALNGGARGALCLLIDITEIAQLREQVALKRNLESLGEMSAGLAHEFKNALATLHGYAQLIQNLNLDDRGRAASASLVQEVRSLSEMVTAFLNFARPQPLQVTEVSLREIVDDCVDELRPIYEQQCVSLSIEGEFPEIRADERMLRQAVINIVRNAAEAIDEQREDRRVKIVGHNNKDSDGERWAVVEVSDTGEGIPAADLQKIFIPFFTTKSKGSGVGLALAHRVITDHGGSLAAGNGSLGGAVFTIRLPIEDG
jgi:PAS domain S-box-containing protein